MKSEHTPGPWVLNTKQRHHEHIEITHNDNGVGAASRVIARVTVRKTWEAEQRANARLIAAAPELLEALEDLARLAEAAMLEANRDWYDIDLELADARAAIRKARGESHD